MRDLGGIKVGIFITLILLLLNTYLLWKINPIEKDMLESLRESLAGHEELSEVQEMYPRISVISKQFLDNAKLQNLTFFENASPKNLLLEYPGTVVVYDYQNDIILNIVKQHLPPNDILVKLSAHSGFERAAETIPQITLVDKDILISLAQQSPEIARVTDVGDYILQYADALVSYNYADDKIKGVLPLGQQNTSARQ